MIEFDASSFNINDEEVDANAMDLGSDNFEIEVEEDGDLIIEGGEMEEGEEGVELDQEEGEEVEDEGEQGEEVEKWLFDCICGQRVFSHEPKSRHPVGDMFACESCGVWSHLFCYPEVQNFSQKELQSAKVYCRKCRPAAFPLFNISAKAIMHIMSMLDFASRKNCAVTCRALCSLSRLVQREVTITHVSPEVAYSVLCWFEKVEEVRLWCWSAKLGRLLQDFSNLRHLHILSAMPNPGSIVSIPRRLLRLTVRDAAVTDSSIQSALVSHYAEKKKKKKVAPKNKKGSVKSQKQDSDSDESDDDSEEASVTERLPNGESRKRQRGIYYLDLSGTSVTGSFGTVLPKQSFETLMLCATPTNDTSLLAGNITNRNEWGHFPGLLNLDLSHTQITDATLTTLPSKLESLNVSFTKITFEGMAEWLESLPRTSLKTVMLVGIPNVDLDRLKRVAPKTTFVAWDLNVGTKK